MSRCINKIMIISGEGFREMAIVTKHQRCLNGATDLERTCKSVSQIGSSRNSVSSPTPRADNMNGITLEINISTRVKRTSKLCWLRLGYFLMAPIVDLCSSPSDNMPKADHVHVAMPLFNTTDT